jgi:tetratricopeptide (TPR) repeat protein
VFLLLGLSALAASTTNASRRAEDITSSSATNDPVEIEFKKLMEEDDAAQAEVDRWILENREFAAKGAGTPKEDLNRRIRKRFEPIRQGYERFIERHPDHSAARVAYASFLGDQHDEDGAREQLEKALAISTNDPAIYNNLANIYGHSGPVKRAFEFYARAIDLNPRESVYYHNYGTTVFLFRKDAMEHFGITEQQVFDKAMSLYSNALRSDPTNFPLATDIAQTYYGIKPLRTNDALLAWTNALALAHDEIEREGVYTHLARIKLITGRLEEARAHLRSVTNELYADVRKRLERRLLEEETLAKGTNFVAPAASP